MKEYLSTLQDILLVVDTEHFEQISTSAIERELAKYPVYEAFQCGVD